jgi:hypothetical protein
MPHLMALQTEVEMGKIGEITPVGSGAEDGHRKISSEAVESDNFASTEHGTAHRL